MGIKTEEIVLITGKVIKVRQLSVLAKIKLLGTNNIKDADVYQECISMEDKIYLDNNSTDNLNDAKLVISAINEVNKPVNTTDPKN